MPIPNRNTACTPRLLPHGRGRFRQGLGIVEAGVELKRRISGRSGLPGILPRHRFRTRLRLHQAYIHKDGFRINTGLKYWRITGNTEHKEHYRPDRARAKAALHADNLSGTGQKQIDGLFTAMDRKTDRGRAIRRRALRPLVVRGPQWIEFLVRKIAAGKGRAWPHHPFRLSGGVSRQPGVHSVDVKLGLQRVLRALA